MRGGYGSSDHGTLADRNSGARPMFPAPAEPGPTGPARPMSAARPTSPARHCHVDGQPSLLVEWRRGAGDWEGRVLSVVWLEAVGWATVERWLPVAQIEPC